MVRAAISAARTDVGVTASRNLAMASPAEAERFDLSLERPAAPPGGSGHGERDEVESPRK